jgi:hypothetical protein
MESKQAGFAEFFPVAPVDADGLYASRQIEGGRWLTIEPLTFQRARLCRSAGAGDTVRQALHAGGGYSDVWEYASREEALVALEMWNGNMPTGWRRNPTARSAW